MAAQTGSGDTFRTRAYRLLTFHIMKSKPVCGARTRRGTPCQAKRLLKGRKCRFHGGMSSGARTAQGKARAIAAMHGARHSPEGRQAHSQLVTALWADPGFRLRVTRTKAARAGKRDQAFVLAARLMGYAEIDRRAQWAVKRRAVRVAKIRALEAEVAARTLNARIAAELGLKLG